MNINGKETGDVISYRGANNQRLQNATDVKQIETDVEFSHTGVLLNYLMVHTYAFTWRYHGTIKRNHTILLTGCILYPSPLSIECPLVLYGD